MVARRLGRSSAAALVAAYGLDGLSFDSSVAVPDNKLPNTFNVLPCAYIMGRSSEVLDTSYSFDALRGVQAGREFYVAMCPLKIIPKLSNVSFTK